MATVVFGDSVEVPGLNSLEEFRIWARSDQFPQQGRIDYVSGRVEVDISPEDFFTHGTLKTAIASRIADRVNELDLGHTCISDTRISAPDAELSAEPDVVVLSYEALDEGRASLLPKTGAHQQRFVEIVGAADLVVEIVSDSSVTKDTQRLPIAYYQAGLREYWLVDARNDPLRFEIQHRGDLGFRACQTDDHGFQRSTVLDSSCRISTTRHARGHVVYQLEMKASS